MSLPTPLPAPGPFVQLCDKKVVKIDFIRDPPYEIYRILRGED